jgi:mannose-6-phosphate isomerase-like protein (cupin superfamily)
MAAPIDYRSLVGSDPDKMYKSTVFESPRLLLGINCLEPGQADRVHTHDDQDKFYYVIEGEGEFTMGDEVLKAGAGQTVPVPAGVPHAVRNTASARLVILMGLTPWPLAGT